MLYDTKLEDFDDEMKQNFYSTIARLGKSEEWGRMALRINPKEGWEQYRSFGGMEKEWFQVKVNKMLGKSTLTLDTFYAEYQQLKKILKETVELVNQLEKRVDELEREK